MSRPTSSRRDFLAAAGAVVTGGSLVSDVEAFGRRRCQGVVRQGSPSFRPLSPKGESQLFVRPDIAKLTVPQLETFRKGVAAMQALDASDPRSWWFQANIHGTTGPITSRLFNQCEHGTLLFFAWHRGYLYYFERILRQAAGDPDFTLPYWDWTSAPTLPEPFRLADSDSNPLFDASRNINDGSALPENVVVSDLEAALNFTSFSPTPGVGFSPSLEGSPHGAVHVLIGGNMGSVPTAANDPIFWLHHCNIDRQLNRWLNMGDGRANPADGDFLDRQYSFVDENGETVTRPVRDLLDSDKLGYRYDNVPNPQLPAILKTAQPPGPVRAKEPPRVMASSPKEETPRGEEPIPLRFKPVTVKLSVPATKAPALRAAAAAAPTAAPGKILLRIGGLSLAEPPSFTYAVYLNLPEGSTTPETEKAHYVGTVNFFGKAAARGHGAVKPFDETFDVTAVVGRQHGGGRWKADDLTVTLRPITPIPPKGEEEKLRLRSEESAKKARVSYQRIELLVAP